MTRAGLTRRKFNICAGILLTYERISLSAMNTLGGTGSVVVRQPGYDSGSYWTVFKLSNKTLNFYFLTGYQLRQFPTSLPSGQAWLLISSRHPERGTYPPGHSVAAFGFQSVLFSLPVRRVESAALPCNQLWRRQIT